MNSILFSMTCMFTTKYINVATYIRSQETLRKMYSIGDPYTTTYRILDIIKKEVEVRDETILW